jgi:hypothetical protein
VSLPGGEPPLTPVLVSLETGVIETFLVEE